MAIVKDQNERTIRPLYPEERLKLLSWLEDPGAIAPTIGPPNPKRLTLFLYETGMHPDVLTHPKRRKLHVAPDGRIVWVRSKKTVSSPDSFIYCPPHRRIASWYREFLASVPEYACDPAFVPVRKNIRGLWVNDLDETGQPKVRKHCNCSQELCRPVTAIGDLIGLAGFGARSCRHTFACRWYELSRDINVVMDKTGCTLAVALRYAKIVQERKWDSAGADME